jgi:hypothetical protein
MSQMSEEEYCHYMLGKLREDHERAAKPFVDRLVRIKQRENPARFVEVPPAARCAKGHLLTSIYHMPSDSFTVGCNECFQFGNGVQVGPMGKVVAETQALKSYLDTAKVT